MTNPMTTTRARNAPIAIATALTVLLDFWGVVVVVDELELYSVVEPGEVMAVVDELELYSVVEPGEVVAVGE